MCGYIETIHGRTVELGRGLDLKLHYHIAQHSNASQVHVSPPYTIRVEDPKPVSRIVSVQVKKRLRSWLRYYLYIQGHNAILHSHSDHIIGRCNVHIAISVVVDGWHPLNFAKDTVSVHRMFRQTSLASSA